MSLILHMGPGVIGLCFERQVTPNARMRRWAFGPSVPRWPSNAHDAVELCWVERGRCRYRIGARTIEVEAGGALLVPSGMEHHTSFRQ